MFFNRILSPLQAVRTGGALARPRIRGFRPTQPLQARAASAHATPKTKQPDRGMARSLGPSGTIQAWLILLGPIAGSAISFEYLGYVDIFQHEGLLH